MFQRLRFSATIESGAAVLTGCSPWNGNYSREVQTVRKKYCAQCPAPGKPGYEERDTPVPRAGGNEGAKSN